VLGDDTQPIEAGYSTGMSQPLNSTIFAPIWRWTAFKAVSRTTGLASTTDKKNLVRCCFDSGWAAGIWNCLT